MLGVLKTTLFNLGLTEEEENRLQELGDKFKNQIPSEEKITEMEKEQERFAKLKEEKTQLETKMSYFEAMAMKREEPDYTVKNRLPMMICGIILLVIGAAGGVLSFLLPQVHKFFLPLLAVSVVAAVAGIVLLVVRKVQVSKEEEKVRALRVQHLEEERKLRGPGGRNSKNHGRGFERSFAHRTGDQGFSGAVSDGSGRKGCQNLLV